MHNSVIFSSNFFQIDLVNINEHVSVSFSLNKKANLLRETTSAMHSVYEEAPKHTHRINAFNVRHQRTVISRCHQNIGWSRTLVYKMAPFELTF